SAPFVSGGGNISNGVCDGVQTSSAGADRFRRNLSDLNLSLVQDGGFLPVIELDEPEPSNSSSVLVDRAPVRQLWQFPFDMRGRGYPRSLESDGDRIVQTDIGAYELGGVGYFNTGSVELAPEVRETIPPGVLEPARPFERPPLSDRLPDLERPGVSPSDPIEVPVRRDLKKEVEKPDKAKDLTKP
ncbi:MAG: hypothetical protein AAF253_12780, partial [Pseudomonadota bacterium]